MQCMLFNNACIFLPRSFVVDIFETHGLVYIEAKAIWIRLSYGHKGAPRHFAGLTTHGFATSMHAWFCESPQSQLVVFWLVVGVVLGQGNLIGPRRNMCQSSLNLKSLPEFSLSWFRSNENDQKNLGFEMQ